MAGQTAITEFTKASSRGQVVIPAKIRKKLGIREGSLLAIAAEGDMIILKKATIVITKEDLKTLKLIEEAWNDIEEGRYKERSKAEFLDELKAWKSRR